MIIKFNQYKLITEDPDSIEFNIGDGDDDDYSVSFTDSDAKPFFADVNDDHTKVEKIYVGKFGDWHKDITHKSKGNMAYPGRLWLNAKIMAFWVYPNVELFKQIIKKLEKKLDIKIFNNGWKIEIIRNDYGEIELTEFDPEEDSDYFFRGDEGGCTYEGDTNIISIDEYAGSEDVSEEKQIQHLMNWKEKELARKAGKLHFGSFGSNLTAWDQPHNIRYRQAIRTSENKNF